MAPLIERSSWNQLATLSGHNKAITVSRINQRLYKDNRLGKEFDPATGEYRESLACYSVVAIASIDSTISIWKPYLSSPFIVSLDIFKMGITDLSWGFDRNILLASSHDGAIVFMHFKPGVLGTPLTETEK
jgi:WD40 repeat protein